MENMEINISEDTLKKVINAEKVFGIKRQELIDRAVLFYLDGIAKQIEFRNELEEWDKLSDEALENFEESL